MKRQSLPQSLHGPAHVLCAHRFDQGAFHFTFVQEDPIMKNTIQHIGIAALIAAVATLAQA